MGGHYKVLLRYILEIGLNSRKDVMITKETKANGREVDITSQPCPEVAQSRRPSGKFAKILSFRRQIMVFSILIESSGKTVLTV